MKKNFLRIFSFIFAIVAIFGFSNLNFAHARRSREENSRLNDFYFSEFNADYLLRRDEKGNSYLEVTENLTAIFKNQDTNHGIERAIPNRFEGREIFDRQMTALRNGENEPIYLDRNSGGNSVFRIGDADKFVNGEQKYTLKYRLFNVVSNKNSALILNTNGTEWRQGFGILRARLTIDDSAKDFLTGDFGCYFGEVGEKNTCQMARRADEKTFEFGHFLLKPGQNLTFRIGVKDGAFPQPTRTFADRVADFAGAVSIILIVEIILAIIAVIVWRVKIHRQNKREFFVAPQYLPPKIDELDILDAGNLENSSQKFTAAILFFAVNGNIRISDKGEQGVFRKKILNFEKLNDDNLNADMRELLNSIFGGEKVISDFSKFSYSKSTGIFNRVQNLDFLKTDFYVRLDKIRESKIFSTIFGANLALAAVVFFAALFFEDAFSIGALLAALVFVFVASIAGFIIVSLPQLSPKGFEMKNYLRGLKMYLSLSEKDRLKFNQSFESAPRFVDEFGGSRVKLYEKLLPWAALFGLEKSWGAVLEAEFAAAKYQPDWLAVSAGWHFGAVSRSISSISQSVNAYSNSISSSSGGGGGFSGGGAGGGGGGGW